MPDFIPFPKMSRWSRDVVITEKIDGTNAQIFIGEDSEFLTGSRTRWITPEDDNYGFSCWAHEHKDELLLLGPGQHFGEWWGAGIQRRYDMVEKVFSLFNVGRWNTDNIPSCVRVVPTLYKGMLEPQTVLNTLDAICESGSIASPGFIKPEGIVIFHTAASVLFKKTLDKDEVPKGFLT
jgi:hypothetical protein